MLKRFLQGRPSTDEHIAVPGTGSDRAHEDASDVAGLRGGQASRPALAPVEAAEVVRRVTVEVMTERIGLLGIDRSGAYAHYNLMLARGYPLPAYDDAIPELIRQGFYDLRSYHVVGSGLGTLPLLLACEGFPAMGIERDEPRHLTSTAILHRLARQVPEIEGNCRLIGAAFPDAVGDIDVSNSMAIVTDFVTTVALPEYVAVCKGLARYRYVLLDLQRFYRKRDTVEEQEELIRDLSHYGLNARSEAIDLGQGGSYRLFESRLVAERQDVLGSGIRKSRSDADGEILARIPAKEVPQEVEPGNVAVAIPAVTLPPRPRRAKRLRFGGLTGISAMLVIGIPSAIGILYYGFLAANQYVTSFEFAVRGGEATAIASHRSSSLGVAAGAMTPDAFIVSDYIASPQAAEDVKPFADPRVLFSSPKADFLTRLDAGAPPDELDRYWERMVNAQFDIISGNVTVTVRAFSPEDSLRLANGLIAASNTMFSKLNEAAELGFIKLADENLSKIQERVDDTRNAMRAFRAKHGVLNPDKAVLSNTVITEEMRKALATLRTRYAAELASTPRSPTIDLLKARIAAIEDAIGGVGGDKGSQLREAVTPADLEQYETLSARMVASEKMLDDAMQLQEQAYLTAEGQKSYLALFVSPKLPHLSAYPNRVESIVIVILASMAAWFIGLMITYAVKDHLI